MVPRGLKAAAQPAIRSVSSESLQSPKRQRGASSKRPPARQSAICAPGSAATRARVALLTCLPCAALFAAGCTLAGRGPAREASRFYPPPPQTPRVVALGTLRGAPPPSQAETDLALFLFGAEHPPALTIANPTALAADDQGALVCDGALDTVFVWDATTDTVAEARLDYDGKRGARARPAAARR